MSDKRKEEERRKKREEEKRKAIQRSKEHQSQELIHRRKHRSLHDKHRDRKKKDCMMGMPFIIAYQGDPARPFFCNDVRDVNGTPTYELIRGEKKFARLARYLSHHVVSLHAKVLIYHAGTSDNDIERAKALLYYYHLYRKIPI